MECSRIAYSNNATVHFLCRMNMKKHIYPKEMFWVGSSISIIKKSHNLIPYVGNNNNWSTKEASKHLSSLFGMYIFVCSMPKTFLAMAAMLLLSFAIVTFFLFQSMHKQYLLYLVLFVSNKMSIDCYVRLIAS